MKCQSCLESLPKECFAVKPGAPRHDRTCMSCQSKMRKNLPPPPRPPKRKTGPKPKLGYTVNSTTGCWDWILSKDKDGYGRTSRDGTRSAHRYFYEQKFGKLPRNMVPDHQCPHGPNRGCVNPDHMRPLTIEDNSRFKKSTRLTPEVATEIKDLRGKESQYVTARRFGISQSHVSDIQRGRHWPMEEV